MGISAQYSKEIRGNLSYFPCWEPGDKVSPGDIGELAEGVFHRQGTLRETFPELSVVVRREATRNRVSFHSLNAVTVELDATATAPGLEAVGTKASAQVAFSRGGAVIFHAQDCSRRFIDNLGEVRRFIETHRGAWPKGHALVSHVEDAESFSVLVSGGAGASLTLEGSLEALQQLRLAEGGVTMTGARNIGYQRAGAGSVLLRLYSIGFFGKTGLLSGGREIPRGSEAELLELSPHDPAFDAAPP